MELINWELLIGFFQAPRLTPNRIFRLNGMDVLEIGHGGDPHGNLFLEFKTGRIYVYDYLDDSGQFGLYAECLEDVLYGMRQYHMGTVDNETILRFLDATVVEAAKQLDSGKVSVEETYIEKAEFPRDRKSCFTFVMYSRLDLAELVSSRMSSLELKDSYQGKPSTWYEHLLGLYERNQFILSKGIDLSQMKQDKHSDLRTPLWFGLNEIDTLFDLKSRGYDLNQKDSKGRTFLKKLHEETSKYTGESKDWPEFARFMGEKLGMIA